MRWKVGVQEITPGLGYNDGLRCCLRHRDEPTSSNHSTSELQERRVGELQTLTLLNTLVLALYVLCPSRLSLTLPFAPPLLPQVTCLSTLARSSSPSDIHFVFRFVQCDLVRSLAHLLIAAFIFCAVLPERDDEWRRGGRATGGLCEDACRLSQVHQGPSRGCQAEFWCRLPRYGVLVL